MKSAAAARLLMTFVLLSITIVSFVLDWRSNHLLSPEWHPHAKFHDALLLFTMAGVSLTGVWLLWRKSKEPEVAFVVTTLLSLSYCVPPFYITSVVPGTSLWAGKIGGELHLFGHMFYPNLATAALAIILTLVAFWMSRRHTA